ncbi:hypothetical protein [Streptomyces sp. NPDC047028]|uniref:hypothetical protein n=1 Tax=Streptomyces sp. NPDC047028 TaxID=3155793 RepID=UPI0033D84CAE
MKRRSLPVAAALVASASLLLTACGGGGEQSKGNDKIAGAETGTPKMPTSPSASPADQIKRPDITLPSDVKDDFEGWKTGDSTKDVVLADAARAQTATNYAIIKGNPDEPALAFYRQGAALVSGAQWVKSFVDAGITYTGTVRYYDPKVSVFSRSSAAVIFCSDESKAYNKNRKTGKVDKTPTTDDSYLLYSTRLKKNKQGVWQTTNLVSKRGDKTCTP